MSQDQVLNDPSPEAMKAARELFDAFKELPFDVHAIDVTARAMDAFAEAARKDEGRAIVAWICQNHFHEDDLIEMIRQRGAP